MSFDLSLLAALLVPRSPYTALMVLPHTSWAWSTLEMTVLHQNDFHFWSSVVTIF